MSFCPWKDISGERPSQTLLKIRGNEDPAHFQGSLFQYFIILPCRQLFLTPNLYFPCCSLRPLHALHKTLLCT